WLKTNFGQDRLFYAQKYYQDNRLQVFKNLVPKGSNVALVAEDNSWIYHFYLVNPGVTITPTQLSNSSENLTSADFLLCIENDCEADAIAVPHQVLWQSEAKSLRSAKIIKLMSD
ncbi:MAG TPA: hypothetical protein ACFCUY_05400, partial [Xenococcaceae cyanobacterium]